MISVDEVNVFDWEQTMIQKLFIIGAQGQIVKPIKSIFLLH